MEGVKRTMARMHRIEEILNETDDKIKAFKSDIRDCNDSESISVYKETLCAWLIDHAIMGSDLCWVVYDCIVPETDNSYDTYEEVLSSKGLSSSDVWDYEISPSELDEALKLFDEDDGDTLFVAVHFIDLDKDYYRLCEINT